MSISVRTYQYLCGGNDVCGEIVFFNGTISVREKYSFHKKMVCLSTYHFFSVSISNVRRKRNTLAHDAIIFGSIVTIFFIVAKYINYWNWTQQPLQLLKRSTILIKILEIWSTKQNKPLDSSISEDAYEELIVALSEFFGVSKQATSV